MALTNETLTARACDILDDMLPTLVVAALQYGVKPAVDAFEHVTIFFSDIVSFTESAQPFRPRASLLSSMRSTRASTHSCANTSFSRSKRSTTHSCVALAFRMPDHTLCMARFAVEAVAAATVPIDPTDARRGFVSIRLGFHTGPVLAGVVGTS
ncbi:Aste57867_2059 [Aphanomyces stellatus]|uniref:Aste57867_2059 protein n=1 Tax=Aphanomyces stellatus TaxID=120398 RepID=A0A485K6L1_9STRA|nr:hypothetical protein As57867_002055 [Aphanomyces stellatus]VFT79263.1 Aste57867_2059 [Aphanomyces stellatus]